MTRILVAEDDRHLKRVVSLWVQRHGHEVRSCDDGESAWKTFQEFSPNILITDVNMPGMDGVALARRVMEYNGPPTGIIILSARVDMIGIGEELGGDLIIHHPKPFSPSKLIKEVEVLFERLSDASQLSVRE